MGRKLKAGEWVEVRSKEEILRTLDERGGIDGLPFMPEMFEFCGKRFRVFKRAHKTCDTIGPSDGRRMKDAVHLEEVRCNGGGHGGCHASCMIFWKEAWLKPITSAGQTASVDSDSAFASFGTTAGCSEAVVRTQAQPLSTPEGEPIYRCQATELRKATDALPWWDLTQYIEDYTSGNITLREMVESGIHSAWYHLSAAGIGLGSAMRWFYDKFQTLRGGVPFPWRRGVIPRGQRTPSVKLELRPGEWARVKSYHEILNTLDQNNKNRGLYFGCEEVPFCGGTYQVLSRVERIIDEKTGQMRVLKEPGIILDGVYCRAHYCEKRKFCPRAIFTYWREVWLEKTDSPPVPQEKRSIT